MSVSRKATRTCTCRKTSLHSLPESKAAIKDAVAYCKFRGERLPTENEWEYVARGPERHTFPWGENMGPAVGTANAAPRVGDGPAEGIGGRYRGLSGNVWQWVDGKVDCRRGLKGASWVETNPAFRRAASSSACSCAARAASG